MSTKVEVEGSSMDTAKLVVSVALVIAGIYAFYFFETYSTLLRVVGLLAVVGVAVAIGYQTPVGRRLWSFGLESRMEVRKVVWPTRQETIQTTLVVFAMVLVMGVVLWLFDTLLMTIVKALTGQGG
jgi:preprotein translocase subunit SecE